jgi:hypothetical protein
MLVIKESNRFVKIKAIYLDDGVWGQAQYFQFIE